jgi:hypothetical protein
MSRPPSLPKHTCPLIDKLKTRLLNAYRIADDHANEDAAGALREIAHELLGEWDRLEELRSANLALRDCAEYWQAEAEQLEQHLSVCESQLQHPD